MQLPRGTFRSIRKGVNFSEILADMTSSRFTGFCTLSSPTLHGTLVFRSGICVLTKIQDHYGDIAWATLMAQKDLVTDLAISDFNTAQIQLALDFNKKARVSLPAVPSPQKPAAQPASPASRHSREQGKQAFQIRKEQKKRDSARPPVPESEPPSGVVPPEDRQVAPEQVKTKESPKEVAKDIMENTVEKTTDSSDEDDLDMFDSMDLDDVAHKIRKDCKIILKQLQLDHLTEK